MKKVANKERILKVKEILYQETDEESGLSLEDILDRLKLEYGADYDVSLRSIKDDIETLNKINIYIEEKKIKHGKIIYNQIDRLFETNELRILIDAISSSNSIGLNDKNRIIGKIKKLTSENIGKQLFNQKYASDKKINKDRTFRMNVDKIHNAIGNKNKIGFQYGRYNMNKEFITNNKNYKGHPYNLTWDNGFYYLIVYDENKEKIINFRIDRMRNVEELEERFSKDREFNLNKHLESCFNMYPGKVETLKIEFDNHLINAIIDRFGVDIKIEKKDENNFILTTRAAINKGLVRWILNWGSDAKVLSPYSLVGEIKLEIEKMYDKYEI